MFIVLLALNLFWAMAGGANEGSAPPLENVMAVMKHH